MIIVLVQVRMASTRLPGKALKTVSGKPLLWYMCERLKMSKHIDKVVIATADTKECLPIVNFAKANGIECYAGSEKDLADRMYKAAKQFKADVIVWVTGDCPLIDPLVIDRLIEFYMNNKSKYDFVCNTIKPTYPDGLDTAVLPIKTLERAGKDITDPFRREWLYSYICEHPEDYRLANFENDSDLSGLRWTVDYEEDFVFVRKIFEKLYPVKKNFMMEDILDLLKKEPELNEINKKYTRNMGYEEAKKEVEK